ncbi:MAG: gas vesicle protein GvpN [Armatimonadetes bacterium CG_4_10_14_0_8_um_filter_66_14]|nr:MAG: gas vesicle protein GvpN [Armatimonadetes bacterium CG_4_10_14_0_8_um_filter_66_14]
MDEMMMLIEAEPSPTFVETPQIAQIAERAQSYLQCGFPIHFSGPSGVGKTTLALHVAARWGRPIALLFGDEQQSSSDLVGGMSGYRRHYLMDNFIRSVLKTEDEVTQRWTDSRVTRACQQGLTLVYDEFTRSRPEANNMLLSVLEEGVLAMPAIRGGAGYVEVHPSFRAIFTSNPKEYAGVHATQDALYDRLVTLTMDYYDQDTEVAIVQAKTGLGAEEAGCVVRLVREMRDKAGSAPSLRAGIVIGRMLRLHDTRADAGNGLFRQICIDVLASSNGRAESKAILEKALKRCRWKKGSGIETAAVQTAAVQTAAQEGNGNGT